MDRKRLVLILMLLAAVAIAGGVLLLAPRSGGGDAWFPATATAGEEPAVAPAAEVAVDGDALTAAGSAALATGDAATGARPERRSEDEPLLPAADVVVVDPQRAPIAGALVEAATAAGDRDRKTCDADGKTQVQLPATDLVLLRASAPGYLPTTLADHAFGTGATLMLQPAAVLLGRVVTAQGEPVAGVRVLAHGPFRAATQGPAAEATSDAVGAFRFAILVPGTYDLRLEAPRAQPDPATVRLGDSMVAGVYFAAGETRMDFPLAAGRTLRGVVRDARTLAPVANADINLRFDMKLGQVADGRAGVNLHSDARGGFTLEGMPICDGRVFTRAKGFSADWRRVSVRDSHGEEPLTIDLQPSMTLRGRVLTVDGVPVADATVTLAWGQDSRVRMGGDTRTDSEGRFELADQTARNGILLVASKDGLAPGAAVVGNVAPGEVRDNLEIRFQRGIEVRGRVVDETGRGVAAARVTLVPKSVERFRFQAVTDERGQYVVPFVTPFPYWLEAEAEGYGQVGKEFRVDNQRPVAEAGDLVLPTVFTLQGRVVKRGLGAAPGVRVVCEPLKGVPGGVQRAATEAFGRFEIKGLRKGRYRVRVEGPDVFQPEEPPLLVDVPLAAALRIEVLGTAVEATGILAGRIFDQGTSQPMVGFTVRGVDPRRVSIADGGFTIRGLPAGRYDLQFDAAGYQSILAPGVVVVAGAVRTLPVLWMLPGGRLTVVVVDAQGKPMPADRVRVELTDRLARTLPHHLHPVEVQKDQGRIRYDGLAMSDFEVKVSGPKGLQPFTQAVQIQGTQMTTVRAVLRPPPPPPPANKKKPPANSKR